MQTTSRLTLVLACAAIAFSNFAQQTVLFKSGDYTPTKNNLFTPSVVYNADEVVDGGVYRLIQFSAIPSVEDHSALLEMGVDLLNYIPHNAFFAKVVLDANLNTLADYDIVSMEPIQSSFKLSRKLHRNDYPHWALFGIEQIELNSIYFDGISKEFAEQSLIELGADILKSNSANTIRLRIDIEQLSSLYSLPAFYYFEAIAPPAEPENIDGRTNHRSNLLATDFANGLKYDGTGVTVMMQDDGYIGDHIDYTGRIDQSNCAGCSLNDNNNHGDHVAGTIMGAGNLNPRYKGMAFGANLLVFSSTNDNYDDVPALYATQDLVITSKSYSNGCNAGYTSLSRQLDQQTRNMPSLIHVFSAGNSGTSDCGYGAGSGWGNITGGHKAGKNVVTVGNLTLIDGIAGSSSRGPASDGRIKPDICGVGTNVSSTISDHTYASFTGTSMSCPGIAGTITQLYHAYKTENGGVNPTSGLIKASILNTAEDLGNPGPDYVYGWGRINAKRAYDLVSQNNFLVDTMLQSGNNSHTISVPAGVTKLKVMLYWTDYEAAANANIALVNNLNLEVVDPGLVAFSPWTLNPFPDPATLDDDAVPGVDNLNNMEQVTIDNPLTGTYTINVDGFSVPEGPQEYFVVYSFERDEVLVTFPLGGEGFNPGTSERVRWDATEGTTDFLVEYTEDNGATWQTIDVVPADERSINWAIPSTQTAEAKVRVTRGGQSDESDAVFSIMETPENLDFGWACPDSLNLSWDAVPNATSYEVYMLGAMYMDSVGTASTNNYTFLAPATVENWFSVRAIGANGERSERAIAVRKLPGEFGCLWSSPYAEIDIVCDSISTTNCAQVLNASINTDVNTNYLWYFPTGTPATTTDENPTVCFATSGYQDAALVVDNGAGVDSVYFSNFVFVQGAISLPYFEGFENLVTFNGQENWSTYNPDVNATFLITSNASLSGAKSARLSNHGQATGSIDELISGPVDLSVLDPVNNQMTLSFRYSNKRRDNASDDWLRLYVKASCDDTWDIRRTLHGAVLAPEIQNSQWTPTDSSDWTTVHVTNIISSYFTGDFRFKFQFENGDGNNFYLDDINIYAGAPSDDIVATDELNAAFLFDVFPNPTAEDLNVRFSLPTDAPVRVIIHDNQGKVWQNHTINGDSGTNLVMMETSGLEAGSYFVSVHVNGIQRTKQFIVR